MNAQKCPEVPNRQREHFDVEQKLQFGAADTPIPKKVGNEGEEDNSEKFKHVIFEYVATYRKESRVAVQSPAAEYVNNAGEEPCRLCDRQQQEQEAEELVHAAFVFVVVESIVQREGRRHNEVKQKAGPWQLVDCVDEAVDVRVESYVREHRRPARRQK